MYLSLTEYRVEIKKKTLIMKKPPCKSLSTALALESIHSIYQPSIVMVSRLLCEGKLILVKY